MNVEAKLCKGEIYHRCLQRLPARHRAVQQGAAPDRRRGSEAIHLRARAAMAEIMEMLS